MAIGSNVDGMITIGTKIDTSGAKRGISDMKGMFKSFGNLGKFAKAGWVGLAIGVGVAVAKIGKHLIDLSADLEETQNVVDTAFGSMSHAMEEFAATSLKTYGINELSAKKTGSLYMSMARSLGLAVGTGSDVSIGMTKLSADLASFYNVSQDVSGKALESIFTGMTKPLRRFGIVMTHANLNAYALTQGITKQVSEMTREEQTLLRFNYVMSKTTLQQGDFNKTQATWANQSRILQQQVEVLKIRLGGLLKDVLIPILTVVNKVISAVIGLFNIQRKQSDNQQALVDNQSDITDNAQQELDINKKLTKEKQKQLLSFDEIERLGSKTVDSDLNKGTSSTTTLNIVPQIPDEYSKKVESEVSELSKLKEKIAPLRESLEKLGTALSNLGEVTYPGLKALWDDILSPLFDILITWAIPGVIDLITAAVDGLSTAMEALGKIIGPIWEDEVVPFVEKTGKEVAERIDTIRGEIDEEYEAQHKFNEELKEKIDPEEHPVLFYVETAKDQLSRLPDHFSNMWERIKKDLRKISGWLDKYVWYPINNAFVGVINLNIATFEGFVNIFIKGWNLIIDAINSIDIQIPEWVPGLGGQSWSPNLKHSQLVKFERMKVSVYKDPKPEDKFSPFTRVEPEDDIADNKYPHSYGYGDVYQPNRPIYSSNLNAPQTIEKYIIDETEIMQVVHKLVVGAGELSGDVLSDTAVAVH